MKGVIEFHGLMAFGLVVLWLMALRNMYLFNREKVTSTLKLQAVLEVESHSHTFVCMPDKDSQAFRLFNA